VDDDYATYPIELIVIVNGLFAICEEALTFVI